MFDAILAGKGNPGRLPEQLVVQLLPETHVEFHGVFFRGVGSVSGFALSVAGGRGGRRAGAGLAGREHTFEGALHALAESFAFGFGGCVGYVGGLAIGFVLVVVVVVDVVEDDFAGFVARI